MFMQLTRCCESFPETFPVAGRPLLPIGDGETHSEGFLPLGEAELNSSWEYLSSGAVFPSSSSFGNEPGRVVQWHNLRYETLETQFIAGITAIHLTKALRCKIVDDDVRHEVTSGNLPYDEQDASLSRSEPIISRATTLHPDSHLSESAVESITVRPPIYRGMLWNITGNTVDFAGDAVVTHAQLRVDGVAVGGRVPVDQEQLSELDEAYWYAGMISHLGADLQLTFPAGTLSNSLIEIDFWVSVLNLKPPARINAGGPTTQPQEWMFTASGVHEFDPYEQAIPVQLRGESPVSFVKWNPANRKKNEEFTLSLNNPFFTADILNNQANSIAPHPFASVTTFGPGAPAGWEYTRTETSQKWSYRLETSGANVFGIGFVEHLDFAVEFNWTNEIPEILVTDPYDKPAGDVSGPVYSYVPATTGDFQTNATGLQNIPGLWNPDAATTFVHYARDNVAQQNGAKYPFRIPLIQGTIGFTPKFSVSVVVDQ